MEYIPTILIVDDVPQNLQLLGNLLSSIKCRIAAAMNGKQAIEIAVNTHPDLILLDIMMPEINGYEVCERLKAQESTKDIPIIFLTAKVETDDIVKGFKKGASDYVTKPFNTAELLARVNTHLSLKQARDSEKKLIAELQQALNDVKTLSGLLPICASCKKIRDDQGYWQQVEEYISDNSNAKFSHSLCPDCIAKLYPEIAEKMKEKH